MSNPSIAPSSLLVTGGTGSLGRALVTWALKAGTDRVIVFSRDEFKQALFHEQIGLHPHLRLFLGDVRDLPRLVRAFHGIETVVHTAALKWIADGVYNVDEIVKTNVIGTMNVIEAAVEAGVRRVLLISSDKGCHPANAYGASKFMAEQYAVQSNAFAFPRGTRVSCVRYGNVMWSRGSVMHRFRARFLAKQPMRLTHKAMSRFGIRLSEAVEFVKVSLDRMRGGEIFVPRLPSFRVEDCALAVGNTVPEITGLRLGGEKLHEMLVTEEESRHTVEVQDHHGFVRVIEPEIASWERPAWKGLPVAEGWTYTSEKNSEWLTVTDLRGTWNEMDSGLPTA